MTRQGGPIKITGTIGNLIFYKRGDNYFIKAKPEVAPKNLVKGKGFNLQRARLIEFSNAGKSGNLLYRAFSTCSGPAKGINMSEHLIREALKAIQADKQNDPGKRNITDGGTTLLEGFEFNENAPLKTLLLAPFTAIIDRKTGRMSVAIQELCLKMMVNAPAWATHVMLQIAGAEVDFVKYKYTLPAIHGIELPLEGILTEVPMLTVQLTPNSPHPLFLALRVSFSQEYKGMIKSINTITHNAMAFVKVAGI